MTANMKNKKLKKSGKSCLFKIIMFFIILFSLGIVFLGGLIFYYMLTVPDLEELTPSPVAETSKVYAVDGSLLTEFHATENREIVPFSKMSANIKNAVVAVEDRRFYTHEGVDYKRILGALLADIRAGGYAQGASTITQQYVKNTYFSHEKTVKRKVSEAMIAVQLERHYTKDKILEMYLNTVYFGSGSYGVEKAAQTYFGKNAENLTISEGALLAGLLQYPEAYSPFNNIEKARNRRNVVLALMKEQGFINASQYNQAIKEPVIITVQGQQNTVTQNRFAPYFIDYVKQELYEKKFSDYDVFKGGLRIYTTLDKKLQTIAEGSFEKVFESPVVPSYSLVSLDPFNGYIQAMVGGKDYNTSKFNIVTQGKRQPGSVFKVPVLMEAIRQNINPQKTYNPNGPISIDIAGSKPWVVDNYGGQKYEGNMSLVDATINSVNVVYAQLIMEIGAKNVEKLLNNMDISDIGSNPAIGLGGLEYGITPLDVSRIFSTLAAGGLYREPVCITKITDSQGAILFEYTPDKDISLKRIMAEPEAFLVTQILQRVITEGTGKNANIGRPCAGKTGTTSDYRDAWFAGYSPELVTIVWMGNQESNQPMEAINNRNITGGSFPAEIWREFMAEALKDRPVTQFKVPDEGMTEVRVCKDSGKLPTLWCPEDHLEFRLFVKEDVPVEYCDIHNKITVPDIRGLTAEQGIDQLNSLFFIINEDYEINDEYDEGTIIKTEPEAGTIIEINDNLNPLITVFISKGSEKIIMPDLIGQNKASAESILNNLGISITNSIMDYSSTQPADLIFNQDPSPGTEVTAATPVTIYISKGTGSTEQTVLVPDIVGLSKLDAVNKLSSLGFNNINVTEEENKAPVGYVFKQTPAAQTAQKKDLPVSIYVSKGIKVPDVTGMLKSDAASLLSSLGFVTEISAGSGSGTKVISQSPAGNTFAGFGSKIMLTLEDASESTSTTTQEGSSTSSTVATTTTSTAASSTSG